MIYKQKKGKMLLDMQDSVTGGLQRFTVGAPTEHIACLEDSLSLERSLLQAADVSEALVSDS